MKIQKKNFAFIYFMYRIIEAYATRLSKERNPRKQYRLYERLNLFMHSHNQTTLSKDMCLGLPLVFAINSPNKTELIQFWQTLKPLHNKRIFIVEDAQQYIELDGNLFNKIFNFQGNIIFLNYKFHSYSRNKENIGCMELMRFLRIKEKDLDPSVYSILNLIDQSINQFKDHDDFFMMVLQPEEYLQKFTKVKIVHKSALQFFDDKGILLGRYQTKALEVIYGYVRQGFESSKERILIPVGLSN